MVMNELLLPDLFTLLDSLDWGISIFDENGKFLWVNRYVLKCSGRPRKFYEGKSVYDFQSLGILDTPVCSEVFRLKKKVINRCICSIPEVFQDRGTAHLRTE